MTMTWQGIRIWQNPGVYLFRKLGNKSKKLINQYKYPNIKVYFQ